MNQPNFDKNNNEFREVFLGYLIFPFRTLQVLSQLILMFFCDAKILDLCELKYILKWHMVYIWDDIRSWSKLILKSFELIGVFLHGSKTFLKNQISPNSSVYFLIMKTICSTFPQLAFPFQVSLRKNISILPKTWKRSVGHNSFGRTHPVSEFLLLTRSIVPCSPFLPRQPPFIVTVV